MKVKIRNACPGTNHELRTEKTKLKEEKDNTNTRENVGFYIGSGL